MIAFFILSPFVVALLFGWLVGRYPVTARILAVWPALLTAVLATEFASVLTTGSRIVDVAWAPSLGLTLSFNLDGLGLLFALLITSIGTLVVLYASRYLAGHPHAGRFYASLFAFMGAMLGVALSDNILTLFVFWELTGFTSFLLIGFEHERDDARSAALQALIVTGAGGLALLAAGVLLFDVSGSTSLSLMAACRRIGRGTSVLCGDRFAGTPRGVHEVRAGAVSFLVAKRHGGANPGQRVSALGNHGQGGHLPRREDDADSWRDRPVDDCRHVGRGRDDGRRGLSIRARDGSQAHSRVFDRERPWPPDDAPRDRLD